MMKVTKIIETGDIWKINNKIVNNWFTSKTRQILNEDDIDKIYVYKKDEDKLYAISFIKTLKLMIELENFHKILIYETDNIGI